MICLKEICPKYILPTTIQTHVDNSSEGTSEERGNHCSNSVHNHRFSNRERVASFLRRDETHQTCGSSANTEGDNDTEVVLDK